MAKHTKYTVTFTLTDTCEDESPLTGDDKKTLKEFIENAAATLSLTMSKFKMTKEAKTA